MLMARIVAAWPGHVVCPRAYAPRATPAPRAAPPRHHPRVADLVAQRVKVLIRGAAVEALEGLPGRELQQHEPTNSLSRCGSTTATSARSGSIPSCPGLQLA